MKKTLVITDVTQMPTANEVCVVGVDTDGRCIRPICEGGFLKKYLWVGDKVIVRPGAKVEFDLSSVATTPPHTEDMRFDPKSIVGNGSCSSQEWENVLQRNSFRNVRDIYGGLLQQGGWVLAGTDTKSIGTLMGPRISDIQLSGNTVKPWFTFVDQGGTKFNRPASDLTLWDRCRALVLRQRRNRLEASNELLSLLRAATQTYLRLGFARPLEDGKCWIQITGVYTFPDYLDGRCFADF